MATRTDPASDAAIMEGARQGCPDALAALYQRYQRPLTAFGLRRLDDRMDAEDLAQESLIRLWRAAATFDPARGTLDCLAFTIASRVLIDVLRRRGRRVATGPLHDVEAASAEDEPARVDLQMTMSTALAVLRPEQRHVLELAYYDGRTQRDIAGLTDLPLGTVKTRTFFALRSMRLVLADQAD